jgi:hypothetical protein
MVPWPLSFGPCLCCVTLCAPSAGRVCGLLAWAAWVTLKLNLVCSFCPNLVLLNIRPIICVLWEPELLPCAACPLCGWLFVQAAVLPAPSSSLTSVPRGVKMVRLPLWAKLWPILCDLARVAPVPKAAFAELALAASRLRALSCVTEVTVKGVA